MLYGRHTSHRSHNDGQRRDDDKHNDFQPNRFGGGGRRYGVPSHVYLAYTVQSMLLATYTNNSLVKLYFKCA